MKKCIRCKKNNVKNPNHDLCHECWLKQENDDEGLTKEDHFVFSLIDHEIPTVYIMFYGQKEKIGYTKDLNSRCIEIKRQYPDNKLVYFREFIQESDARRFEAWLKDLPKRDLIKFISDFQDKIKKIHLLQ